MGRRGTPDWHLKWSEIEVQGRRATYGDAGRGTPFLFLHGWGLSDRTYKRALGRLARLGVRVIAPSLPGFGGTAALPGDEFSLEGYARWVDDFRTAIGIEGPWYLGGHSFGGGVAVVTAHEHGDDLELLVLVNSIGGSVWKASARPGADARHLADRPLWDWGLHFPYDVAGPRTFRAVVPVILRDMARNLLRDPLGFIRVGRMAGAANLLAELEELRRRQLPVVVLWGDEDKVLPAASMDAMVAAIGRDPEVVSGSHGWLLEDPDRFGEIMTNVVGVAEAARTALADERRSEIAGA
ncbi:alpha/beta fold hydrolase [Actinomarinicola tropica]|uniref:alpha/beta fold hydrolase n=1 Tax=Actinomarinicola tropica TaxID=2789776 RepID=UPI001E3A295E|nr:alpha/beta hydrolase [Actinomarinicola tropica]